MIGIPEIIVNHSNPVLVLEDVMISLIIATAVAFADYLWSSAVFIFLFCLFFISIFAPLVLISIFIGYVNQWIIFVIAFIITTLIFVSRKHKKSLLRIWFEAEILRQDSRNEEEYRQARQQEARERWEQQEANIRAQFRSGRQARHIRQPIPNEVKDLIEAYTLFKILPDDSDMKIKHVYKQFVKMYHPDKTHKDTNREMQVINNAWEMIRKSRNKA